MTDKPRIGLVGCGRWGRHILRDLLSLGCQVEVADPDPAARQAAAQLGATRNVSDVGDWVDDALDGFVVASPMQMHLAHIDALLVHAKPVFCEKPLSNDAAAAHDIVQRAGQRLFVMHKWRYHPGIEALETLAKEQRYGAVREIHTRRLQWSLDDPDKDAVWDLAPHDLSIVQAIAGALPPPRSAVMHCNARGRPVSMVALLAGANGPSAHLHLACNWPHEERSVQVVFDDAVAVLADAYAEHLDIHHGDAAQPGTVEQVAIAQEFPLLRQLRSFADHLRGGPPPKTPASEGLAVVAAIDSLRRLARGEEP
ncbi:Gfo/Idh/MocA family oxidoreductase [Mangrovimicrobium sediminis]|uniref:Gfo/Idh/MocA family oxidoreductase n=1 Tax=Mangrovimicrobium sediminis TaxID=2562682 RepID=A0A4Z0M199_9GAMM|nr:Gfo/Idh/MocA family oxidoreductase [Haliea sp. SAOS-164]TGD73382.1 Gfo/Idh/MocA family oxidoreductase [Haliea sp. SAOS-164]